MEQLLNKIDKILFSTAKSMKAPTMNNDLGTLIYFATRYKITNELIFKKKCLQLLKKFITIFNEFDFKTGMIDGFEGVFNVFTYLEKTQIIVNSKDYLSDIEESLITSIQNDIEVNMFDLYYGSIGKINYFLSEDRINDEEVKILINKLIDSLWVNKKSHLNQYYWTDNFSNDEKFEIIDLGIAHGICAIFLFLLRLKELNFNNDKIQNLIQGIIETFKNAENKVKGSSFYPDRYSLKNPDLNLIDSRLAFCVGDLPIAYSFSYASKVLNDVELMNYSNSILKLSKHKELTSSHLKYFEAYDFFDVGFCHGISSILFFFYKLNILHNDELLNFKIDYWRKELIKNTDKLIKTEKPIFYPKIFNDIYGQKELEFGSFLNGLCGAGLVLQSIEYKDAEWSNFLYIY